MKLDRQQKFILLASTLASFLTPFMGSATNLALPAMARSLELSAITLGWTVTAYLLTTAIFLVPMGRLADLIGRRKIFVAGIGVFLAGALLSGLAFSGLSLIAFRLIQGVGGAMIFATSIALLTSHFPPENRGQVLGINTAATYTGLSLGPVLGGLLVHYVGWRSVFFFSLVPGLLALYLVTRAYRHVPTPPERSLAGFDIRGSAIYGLGLVCFMLGFSRLPAAYGFALAAVGLVLLTLFFFFEGQQRQPVLDTTLFRKKRVFAFSNLAALINYSSTFAVSYLLSLYLQYIHGFSPRTAGLVLVAQPVVQAVFSPAAGRTSDRVEPRLLASTGMGLTVIGLVALSFLTPETSLLWVVLGLVFLGTGFGLFSSPNTNAIMGSVESNNYGLASATLATMRMVGQMFSLGLTMMIISVVMGNVRITPDNYPLFVKSLRLTLTVFAGLNFLGLFASLARGKKGDTLHIS
ncbi:MAG: MFS transporter [Candidatus Saccharicenans sp.]|jgi:EmrB/QacA subfamily drug resistance transporter|nr:MFS transporter [Candidatus Saccharicenans sp.]MDH7494109.1 MFS transporter [Candidatus Saccharicenans sp.]